MAPDTLLGRVMRGPSNLFAYDDMWNRRAIHAAEMPSSNGIGTARALARLYAAVIGEIDGIRLLRPETLDDACIVQSDGNDRILHLPTRFGSAIMYSTITFRSSKSRPTVSGLSTSMTPGCTALSQFAPPANRAGNGLVFTRQL